MSTNSINGSSEADTNKTTQNQHRAHNINTSLAAEYTSGSSPLLLSSNPSNVLSSSSTRSLYENLRQEATSCCPVCGFQIFVNNSIDTNTVQSANAIVASHLPAGTCFLCSQAVVEANHSDAIKTICDENNIACISDNWRAKEKQVEEDRQLAATLSAILLEEEREQEENIRRRPSACLGVVWLEESGCGNTNDSLEVARDTVNYDNYFNDINDEHCFNGKSSVNTGLTTNNSSYKKVQNHADWNHRCDCNDNHHNNDSSYPSQDTETMGGFATTPSFPAAAAVASSNSCNSEKNQIMRRSNESEMLCNPHNFIPRAWLIEDQEAIFAAAAENKNTTFGNHQHNPRSFRDDPLGDGDVVYIGEYNLLGQPHGLHGEVIWKYSSNSSNIGHHTQRYVGSFQNGMRSGQGTFFFRDGSEYTGEWKENQMHGDGTRKFANGDTYTGRYHKGMRNGGPNCKFRFANGDLYVGAWEVDRFHGDGRYFFAHDGSVLEGTFVHGVKEGKFKLQRQIRSTEKLDILRFEDDKLVGLGVRWNSKRTKTWLLTVVPVSRPAAQMRKLKRDGDGNGNRIETNEAMKAPSLCRKDNSKKSSSSRSSSNNSSNTDTKKPKFHRRLIGCLAKPLRYDFRSRNNPSSSLEAKGSPARGNRNINGDTMETIATASKPYSSSSFSTPPPKPTLPLPLSSTSSSSFISLPVDNTVPVFPQEIKKFTTCIKKSVRIPISQAVSIQYDCEMGTTTITAKKTRTSTILPSSSV